MMQRIARVGLVLLCFCGLLSTPLWAAGSSRDFLLRVLGDNGESARASEARLASGRELLTDDPANEAIYQSLRSQVRGMGRELANNADMISFYRFEDSILARTLDSLQRIRQLAVRRGDPVFSADDRAIVDDEIDQYYKDILQTLSQADFNGIKPFAAFAAGPSISSWFAQKQYYRLDAIDRLMSTMIRERGLAGAAADSLSFSSSGEAVARANNAAEQSLSDTDMAAEHSALMREDLLFLVDLFLLK
jgi:flagellin-like hook-associated protein FlgL